MSTRLNNVTSAQWSASGEGLGSPDLTIAGNQVFGANVFNTEVQRQRLPKPAFKKLQGVLKKGPALDRRAGRRGRPGDEGVGDREGRDPLHPLVPADDRPDGREARLVPRPDRRRHGDRRVLRQGAGPGRARRLELPLRRHPRHVRGPRLHRVGPDQPRLHPREPQRHHPLHPDRLRLLDRRGARQEDAAAALDGRLSKQAVRVLKLFGDDASPTSSRPSAPSRSTS